MAFFFAWLTPYVMKLLMNKKTARQPSYKDEIFTLFYTTIKRLTIVSIFGGVGCVNLYFIKKVYIIFLFLSNFSNYFSITLFLGPKNTSTYEGA